MKVAISALGPDLDSKVDDKFGRAMWFIVYDTETQSFEAIDNAANRNAMQGAGFGAAETVSNAGATAVITGHLGPNAFRVLGSLGIEGYVGSGKTVREVIEAFTAGALARIDAAGESHQE
ncbi:MAG: NifB/NifX family molybdenum-iron cluster-binding protein [Anaerosomatales bacterium]|nr:NifB/NifX family molybdenum-iron cluster-binding protein [Coriobacteriia bacterium]MDI6691758.1 NifB/NifX family molybdenum-iron cluster-binding protein [Anaerosomatales bacterium]MDI6842894.1 NifB/NifX family molybdenum-iron cluster-binding protein [Anaerosomatales bacterium]